MRVGFPCSCRTRRCGRRHPERGSLCTSPFSFRHGCRSRSFRSSSLASIASLARSSFETACYRFRARCAACAVGVESRRRGVKEGRRATCLANSASLPVYRDPSRRNVCVPTALMRRSKRMWARCVSYTLFSFCFSLGNFFHSVLRSSIRHRHRSQH
ncbi:hypothetical protein B0H13DRAFT_791850 [Mycena leptocephala]|nr:hypothetical protein B0H13DRAFT_791850 [Mycena leptocephala]